MQALLQGIKLLLLRAVKQSFYSHSLTKGFSLVEAMVATAIVGVGMAGIFMLVSLSHHSLNESIMREKLQMVANQMLEVIEGDIANIDQYNLNMAVCVDPGVGAATSLARQYEWCLRMNGEVGAVQAGDTRTVTVTTQPDQTRVIHIELEALGGQIEIVMNRSYGTL